MECKSFGDPQPNMTVTLPDGTREFVNASDNVSQKVKVNVLLTHGPGRGQILVL